MQTTADVVIIGGGIMGASTAYHLAKRGNTSVVLLESGDMFGLGSTGLNAGGVRYQFATPVNIELSKASIAMMERFAAEMDQEVGLRRCGCREDGERRQTGCEAREGSWASAHRGTVAARHEGCLRIS